jgi:ectoine hydroxylase
VLTLTDVYQSRFDNEAAIILRQDPVVYRGWKEEGPAYLSQYQLARYAKKGFILLKQLFSPEEVAGMLEEVERLAHDPKLKGREEVIAEPGDGEVRSVFMVHRLSHALERLARDIRLVNIARQILGSQVYIHQSRANRKPGFRGKEFYWHSDFETWHVEDGMPRMRAVSCSILLTDNDEHNGPLMIIPGSHMHYIRCVGETPSEHYKHSLRKQEYGVPDEASLRFLVERGGIESMKAPAGSVVFFDCNAMHGSNSNITPRPRTNLFFVYNSVENTLGAPLHGLAPRPEFVATRGDFTAIEPVIPEAVKSDAWQN